MSQVTRGQTFSDILPDALVTSGRLNKLVDDAQLLNGAVLDQADLSATRAPTANDYVLVGDSQVSVNLPPKKLALGALLPEGVRLGTQQYGVDTGTVSSSANLYVVALTPAVTVYTAGMVVQFKALHTNLANLLTPPTGASTLALNGITSPVAQKIVTRDGAELAPGDIKAGQIVTVVYDGTNFQMVNGIAPGEITATHQVESARMGIPQYESVATTYSAPKYTVTLAPPITGYTAGLTFMFTAPANCAAGATVAVSSLTAVAIYKSNGAATNAQRVPVAVNDIKQNDLVTLVYDGTHFVVAGLRNPTWDYTCDTDGAVPATSGTTTFTHGLNAFPSRFEVVLVCSSTDNGYAKNEMVKLSGIYAASSAYPPLSVSCSDSTITVARNNGTGSIYMIPKGGGAYAALNLSNWTVRAYASI